MTTNYKNENFKVPFRIMKSIKIAFLFGGFLISCSTNLDKWYMVDTNKVILRYRDIEYRDYVNFNNQNNADLLMLDSLSGEAKFIKSEEKIYLGYKMRIMLKGKSDKYRVQFGFKILDKDGFLITDYLIDNFYLCTSNEINSFQSKIETRLSVDQLKKVNSIGVSIDIFDDWK
jgi:hypothetical protein